LDKLKNNHILSCNFYNDEYRYTYLKQLFYCLQDWGLKQNELNKFKKYYMETNKLQKLINMIQKIENDFLVKVYRCIIDDNIDQIAFNFKVENEENNMHDFYIMCIHVFRSIINNKLTLFNINNNIINVTEFEDDLDSINEKISNLLNKIEYDKRLYNQSKMDINDYIKMRDRKNKIQKILYGNQ